MQPTLRGVHVKLHRAYEHHATLRDESPSIVGGNRIVHRTIPKAHPDGRGYNFNLPPLQKLDANRWSVVLGDFLFNLRSAIDQLVYQLHVIEFDGTIPERIEHDSAFPILGKAPQTRGGKPIGTDKWSSIKNLPADQRALIESFQPYQPRDRTLDTRRAALFLLNSLNNIDKHRRLHVVRQVASRMKRPVFPRRYGFVHKPKFGPVKSGAKVDEWRFKFISDDLRTELERQVEMHAVALEEFLDEPGWTLPVFEMTREMHNKVLATIKPFTKFFVAAGASGPDVSLPEPIPQWYRW